MPSATIAPAPSHARAQPNTFSCIPHVRVSINGGARPSDHVVRFDQPREDRRPPSAPSLIRPARKEAFAGSIERCPHRADLKLGPHL